jgi:hypothetical protein
VLTEIAVLQRSSGGFVIPVPAVRDGCPVPEGLRLLADLLNSRGVAAAW